MSTASLLLPALFLAAIVVAAESESLTLRPGCQASCGGVKVPYPFGIGTDCFRPGFEIACVNKTPVLTGTTQVIQVLELSVMPRPEARVMLPVAWQCFNTTTNDVIESFDGRLNINPAGVYRISNTANELFVLGCNTIIFTNSGPPAGRRSYPNSYYAGCVTFCNDSRSARDGACAGIGCCRVDIPPGLTDNWMRFYSFTHIDMEFSPCDFAFIVEKDYYSFQEADLHMGSGARQRKMPMRLDWAIRDSNINSTASLTCSQAANRPGYTCVSDHSECFDSINGPGYFCNCTEGYDGNPYLHKGCTNINECECNYSCNGICHDTEGSYSCICHSGYESIGDPKKFPCTSKFPFAARLALGIGLGVFFLVFALLLAFIMHQKRILAKNFDMNGGNILKKATGLDIFTEKDLHKITKNNSDPLGKGYFGEVYKGTLYDEAKTTVAVKSFLKVDKERIEEFTEEVMIQVKMNHANVLKLMGCCLQLDVPMLVYEFAAKGSLRDNLHGNIKQKLTAELRLDIAIGSAEGLSYMHFQEIRHGDVKPDNILLNEKLIPKISDFGLSKLLKLGDKIAKKVIGCEGYMDPVFRNTGELTPKSDVYSFGVVLLELISRKQIRYGQSGSLIIEFRHIYETEKSGRSMFDKEIVTEEDTLILEEIGKLAMRCLKERLDARPDMTEVAKQLVKLRKNTANDTATFEMSGTTYARLSVPPSPISETSKLIHSQTMHQVGVRR